ncbi:uncharacterized protein [Linepithema humile]|uniref:uncharacterized protein isoform X1 n=1 Tax=Linepithema humile TaxID=83485 RepID=UPI00351F6C3E
MKWLLFLITIAIWQCTQVTGNSVSQRKSRTPLSAWFPFEYTFLPNRDAQKLNTFSSINTNNSMSQRKPRSPINPLFPIEYPSSRYRDKVPKKVYPFLPFYRGFWRATKKEPEHATKSKSNDKEGKPASHIRKREIDTEIMGVKREIYHENDEVWETHVNLVKELRAYLKEKLGEYDRIKNNKKTKDQEKFTIVYTPSILYRTFDVFLEKKINFYFNSKPKLTSFLTLQL